MKPQDHPPTPIPTTQDMCGTTVQQVMDILKTLALSTENICLAPHSRECLDDLQMEVVWG